MYHTVKAFVVQVKKHGKQKQKPTENLNLLGSEHFQAATFNSQVVPFYVFFAVWGEKKNVLYGRLRELCVTVAGFQRNGKSGVHICVK